MTARDTDPRVTDPDAAETAETTTEPEPFEGLDLPGETDAGERFADLPDGAGCAEVWEHLADRRE
jgi:hypothetical protein